MIDVQYLNAYGMSAYFRTKADDGTYVPHEETESSSGLSGGKIGGIVFTCLIIFLFAGLVVYARGSIFKRDTYKACMDDSQSEVVELNAVSKSNAV